MGFDHTARYDPAKKATCTFVHGIRPSGDGCLPEVGNFVLPSTTHTPLIPQDSETWESEEEESSHAGDSPIVEAKITKLATSDDEDLVASASSDEESPSRNESGDEVG